MKRSRSAPAGRAIASLKRSISRSAFPMIEWAKTVCPKSAGGAPGHPNHSGSVWQASNSPHLNRATPALHQCVGTCIASLEVRKSTGTKRGFFISCEFSFHCFSQSSNDGTVTSAFLEYAAWIAFELCPSAC